MKSDKPFYVGLCLAGAVSAGAYTAGVMDYLLEALNDWESQRGKTGVPDHEIKIPVIGGASAGGMTGIITASAINNPISPVRSIDPKNLAQSFPKNKLWHTWVDMINTDMFPFLLDTGDIKKDEFFSLFNSTFIDTIADRALRVDATQWIEPSYFDKNLMVFTTVSNLKGLSYDIGFLGSGEKPDLYCMTQHNDYITFLINASQTSGDGWIPLDFRRSDLNLELAKNAAMATGAFPIGLRSRKLSRPADLVNDNRWLRSVTDLNPIEQDPYTSLNVDGGLINNEPFEKVRDVLCGITLQTDPNDYNDYNKFTSTVLMIDPFPSMPPEFKESDQLFQVAGSTLSALINQARIKPQHLEDAMAKGKAGQYMIGPRRNIKLPDGKQREFAGAEAIACGAFGGFSGFFEREFRVHDFFLGRANCEKFLRDHFTVPEGTSNQIVDGYAKLSRSEKEKFYPRKKDGTLEESLPIIPVLSPRKDEKYMPVFSSGTTWPTITEKHIDKFSAQTRKRVHAITMNLTDYSAWMKAFIWVGSYLVLKYRLAKFALDTIKQSLADHDLLVSKNFKKKVKPSTVRISSMSRNFAAINSLVSLAEGIAKKEGYTFVAVISLRKSIAAALRNPVYQEKIDFTDGYKEAEQGVSRLINEMIHEAIVDRTKILDDALLQKVKLKSGLLFPIN
jgi:predicted acylesterase/phospholipase RssA